MDAELGAFNPEPGQITQLEPGIRRLLAPNPSPMTFRGTNTYLVGARDIAVIDPGPLSEPHMAAILAAMSPAQRITKIIVTHAHLDHSPLAATLAAQVDAPVYAFGGPEAGRSAVMQDLAKQGFVGGGEGVDAGFVPDVVVQEGDVVSGAGWDMEVIHTPGHFGNHICLALGDACFCGDHVMGWSSSLVSPPDGDLTDFMLSCEKLRTRPWRVFYPGHGAPVDDPHERLTWLMDHRQGRERQILQALAAAPATARGLAEQIYIETEASLLPAATRNVFAHLIDLAGKNRVVAQGGIHELAVFELV